MSGVASFQRVDLRMNFYLCLGTGFRTSFCAKKFGKALFFGMFFPKKGTACRHDPTGTPAPVSRFGDALSHTRIAHVRNHE